MDYPYCSCCGGSGVVTCSSCGGTGRRHTYEDGESCYSCGGSGTETCSACNGSGYTDDED